MPVTQVRGYNVVPGVIDNASMLILTSNWIYYPESASAWNFTVGNQFISQTTTAAPFVVSSTSLVTNLNAQYINGVSLSSITAQSTWGQISGTLSAQSDLWIQLQARSLTSHTHTSFSNNISIIGNLSANNIYTNGQFISSVSDGTAPLVISSTSVVNNLNAKYLDGYSISSLLSQFVRLEKPSGLVNGINFTYTITGGTLLTSTETVYYNGIALDPNDDYSISGQVITLLLARAPNNGDKVRVSYFKQVT
jgi:hypothetical protein